MRWSDRSLSKWLSPWAIGTEVGTDLTGGVLIFSTSVVVMQWWSVTVTPSRSHCDRDGSHCDRVARRHTGSVSLGCQRGPKEGTHDGREAPDAAVDGSAQ